MVKPIQNDMVREISNQVTWDKITYFFEKNLIPIILGAILIFGGYIGYKSYSFHQMTERQSYGEGYFRLLQNNNNRSDIDAAMNELKEGVKEFPTIYQNMIDLQLTNFYSDVDKQVDAFENLINNSNLSSPLIYEIAIYSKYSLLLSKEDYMFSNEDINSVSNLKILSTSRDLLLYFIYDSLLKNNNLESDIALKYSTEQEKLLLTLQLTQGHASLLFKRLHIMQSNQNTHFYNK